MPSIFGHLQIKDSDRLYTLASGQQIVYETANAYITAAQAALMQASGLFVQGTTDKFTERYKLPGNGSLQRRGPNGRYGSVKSLGSWDVAYPIEDFGAQLSGNDVEMRYMTLGDLSTHIQTVVTQNTNTVRYEILKALFNKANRTFTDPLHGSLTIRALANQDGTLYPPLVGSEDVAQSQHYIGLNYTAITNTDNPLVVARTLFEDEAGAPANGLNMVVFINRAERASVEALTGFVPVTNRFVNPGADVTTLAGMPANIPGTIIGAVNGVIVSVWAHVPAGYLMQQHLDLPAPLKRRIDPADTGLGDGLQLVATETEFPFESSFWRHRFGYGVGNRLSVVLMQLVGSTTYTTPTIYA